MGSLDRTYDISLLSVTNLAELPVKRPTKFELIINLKTAKEIAG